VLDRLLAMATLISHSPAETESLGERWGREAKPGLVIGLSGDLGAGKTQLVKGIARGLGVTARVHSPTFTLVNEYGGGRLKLFHLDLYRLETREQIIGAGLEEYLQPEGVAVIEWAERWFGEEKTKPSTLNIQRSTFKDSSKANVILVQIEVLNEMERRITYEDPGA
jgi:tRNA threonylcarbamoyladenosine biosynthesis protein TsaE